MKLDHPGCRRYTFWASDANNGSPYKLIQFLFSVFFAHILSVEAVKTQPYQRKNPDMNGVHIKTSYP